jgi:hypothetical protein
MHRNEYSNISSIISSDEAGTFKYWSTAYVKLIMESIHDCYLVPYGVDIRAQENSFNFSRSMTALPLDSSGASSTMSSSSNSSSSELSSPS